jgi:hypothetical protein
MRCAINSWRRVSNLRDGLGCQDFAVSGGDGTDDFNAIGETGGGHGRAPGRVGNQDQSVKIGIYQNFIM